MEPEGKRSSRRLDIVTVEVRDLEPLAGRGRVLIHVTLYLGK